MSPVISHNANGSSNAVQSLRAVEPRARSERTASGAATSEADGTSTPSAIVKINPAARERAQADGAAGTTTSPNSEQAERSDENRVAARASRPAGSSTAANGNRLPANVSAALKAYGSTQPNAPATPTQTDRRQATQGSPSTTASNDPTGATDEGRTKPVRASTQDTAAIAEKDREREQRDQAANLQSAATGTARLGNQAASMG